MKRSFVFSLLFTAGICVLSFAAFAGLAALPNGFAEAAPGKVTQGALRIVGPDGQIHSQCPLKHTAVKAEISGSLARTTVTQEFQNPLAEKIEAVYVFPLPVNAAVDDMTMFVGDRTVKGKIKCREEARAIYEAARDAGQVASLLDQNPAPAPSQISPPPVEEKKIIISAGVLDSAAIKKVQPAYPPIAKAARASGAVQVQIEVNQEGRVTEAKVLSGHPLLRQAALEAAQQWKFKPTNIDNGRTLKVQGVLTFNFRQDGTVITDSLGSRLRNKLHPSVAGVVERLKNKQTEPLTVETTFIHNGKADLQVTLTDKSTATIEQLKRLGFEIIRKSKSSSVIIGRLPMERLEALTRLASVSYVEPVTGLSRK